MTQGKPPFGAAAPLYGRIAACCHDVCAPVAPEIELEIRLHNDGAGWIAYRVMSNGLTQTTDVPAALISP